MPSLLVSRHGTEYDCYVQSGLDSKTAVKCPALVMAGLEITVQEPASLLLIPAGPFLLWTAAGALGFSTGVLQPSLGQCQPVCLLMPPKKAGGGVSSPLPLLATKRFSLQAGPPLCEEP